MAESVGIEVNVVTGVKVVIAAGTRVVGLATGLSDNENFGAEELRVLGRFTAAGIINTRYGCTFRLSSFILDNNRLSRMGILATAATALRSAKLDFRVLDADTGDLRWTYKGCVIASKDHSISANALSGENVAFACIERVEPDAVPVQGEQGIRAA